MTMSKIPIILLTLLAFALVHLSHAQNTYQDFLDAHNAARALVSVPDITWNSTVAAFAQNYANQRKADCNLVNSDGPYGENLARNSVLTGVQAVQLWVAEKQNYDHLSKSCGVGKVCSHYTQVIWKNSVGLGCARVQCNNGLWFVTCNYHVRGNIVGENPY